VLVKFKAYNRKLDAKEKIKGRTTNMTFSEFT